MVKEAQVDLVAEGSTSAKPSNTTAPSKGQNRSEPMETELASGNQVGISKSEKGSYVVIARHASHSSSTSRTRKEIKPEKMDSWAVASETRWCAAMRGSQQHLTDLQKQLREVGGANPLGASMSAIPRHHTSRD